MKDIGEMFLCLFGVIVAIIIIVSVATYLDDLGSEKIQKEAIQRGFAQYNPTNAVFEWKQR